MIELAQKRLQYLEQIDRSLQHALKDSPNGNLVIRKGRNGSLQLYIKERGEEHYIPLTDAAAYASKRYNSEAAKAVKAEIRALERYLDTLPDVRYEDVFPAMPDRIKPLITPAAMTDEQYAGWWQSLPFTPKPFSSKDTSEYYTRKGERVRSKSEVIIADMLNDLDIPYKYEMPLPVYDGIDKIHPDFSILKKRTREVVYHEHLGKMDDPEYTDNFINRQKIYQDNGIYLGQKLFLTCETGQTPLKTKDTRDLLIRLYT